MFPVSIPFSTNLRQMRAAEYRTMSRVSKFIENCSYGSLHLLICKRAVLVGMLHKTQGSEFAFKQKEKMAEICRIAL